MLNRNANARFLARLLVGLGIAVSIIVGSLGHALTHSQAFF
jgi:hypothetical protein